MNIVIAGTGKVGEVLCRDLASENHNIMLIELNEARLDQFNNLYDISGIHGNAAMFEIQTEAGVDTCDVFIAVTRNDETNLIAAITARKLGAKFTVARVRDPEYSKQMSFLRESLGITLIINPELEAAQEIARTLIFPSALQVESFVHGRVNMIEVVLQKNTAPVDVKLKDHKGRFGDVVICIVIRDDRVMIPDGETILRAGDHVMVTGSPGGSRIITTVLQMVVNTIDFGMNVAEATNAPRFHHQWLPDELRVEKGFSPDTLKLLEQKGQKVALKEAMGSTQSIMVGPDGTLYGASDPRSPGDLTAGY